MFRPKEVLKFHFLFSLGRTNFCPSGYKCASKRVVHLPGSLLFIFFFRSDANGSVRLWNLSYRTYLSGSNCLPHVSFWVISLFIPFSCMCTIPPLKLYPSFLPITSRVEQFKCFIGKCYSNCNGDDFSMLK